MRLNKQGMGDIFFGTTHTLANYKTAFYEPIVSDWSNFESWEENGSKTAFERANKIYRQRLKSFQPPEMDDQISMSPETYVSQRRRVM